MRKILYWIPRIFAILLILFISLFALDVFEEFTFPEVLIALFMHLLPSMALTTILIVSWKWERIGGILFIISGICFILAFNTYRSIISFSLISLPVIVVGILFIVSSMHSKLKKKKNTRK